jgi:peptidyl-dipeptidase Dcp
VQRRTFLASAAATGVAATLIPSVTMAAETNPMLAASGPAPMAACPPFDKVKVSDFKPALEGAMAKNLAEIDAITANPAAPPSTTPSGRWSSARSLVGRATALRRLGRQYETPGVPAVETEMDPKLAGLPGQGSARTSRSSPASTRSTRRPRRPS